jgi:hypothetical protein
LAKAQQTPKVDAWMLIEKQELFLAFSYFDLNQTLCVEAAQYVKLDGPTHFASQQA